MNRAVQIASLIFIPLGLIMVLLSTNFFSNWSETALVNSSFGVFFAAGGVLGAYLGRGNIIKALLLGVALALLSAFVLNVFYRVLWPML